MIFFRNQDFERDQPKMFSFKLFVKDTQLRKTDRVLFQQNEVAEMKQKSVLNAYLGTFEETFPKTDAKNSRETYLQLYRNCFSEQPH